MELRRPRGGGLLALGRALAVEGALPKISIAVSVATVLGSIVAAVVMVRTDRAESVATIPLVAASALAWGGGTLLAFGASAHAFRNDRDRGIRALVSSRARSDGEYLWARVFGLTRALALVTAGGSLVVGLACTFLARRGHSALGTLWSTGAAVAYSLAFAAILGPLSLAMLGARSKVGGYLALVFVLALPELLADSVAQALPEGWAELFSIPGALGALRGSLLPVAFDPLRLARAVAVLALVLVVSLWVARSQLVRVDQERPT